LAANFRSVPEIDGEIRLDDWGINRTRETKGWKGDKIMKLGRK
jgi:hypothetical protein